MRLNKFIPFLASLLVAWTAQGAVPNEHYRDALWVAESHGVLKLLAADGTLQIEIDSAEEVRSVAVDAVAGRVWVSRPERLTAYGFDGEPSLDVPLETMRPAVDEHRLSVDRRDGTVWLARGKSLGVFAFDGSEVAALAADKPIQAISLAERAGQRWLATKQRAALRDEQGATLLSLDAPRGEKVHDLAYDAAQAGLWLLTNKKLHFLDLEEERVDWALDLRSAERIRLIKDDGAWVAGNKRLAKISTGGEMLRSFEYSQPGNLVAFVVDEMDGSLWLATQQHLGHYRPDGTVIDQIAFTGPEHTGRLWSLDMYIDDLPPSVRFALPEPGTLTDDNRLPFVLEYSDVGIGTDPATIAFTVNDSDAAFGCTEEDPNSTRCTPGQALPEGENQVAATVADFNGNISDPAQVDVTVDTIPPTITVTEPQNGSEVSESPITVTGHLSETAALTINGETVPLDASLGFTSEVTLETGSNTIQLAAVDPAGNEAQGQLTVVLQSQDVPPDPAKVAPPIDPSKPTTVYDATRFLYEGPDPIQTGVESGVIERKRVAVLRGKVLDRGGQPLSGVTVRAHGHPEYGTTLTREDGMFDLVVNGGGTTTIEYEKSGYMPVQRAIDTPWRDYRWLPDVVLTQYDDRVTRIDLSSVEAFQTARGSTVTDSDGQRTAMVMFPAGVSAEMVMPDGSRQPLDTLDVRATEYTVGPNGPDAMPGELPPTSAYTYAVELSVDQALEAGAESVEFSEPVPFYLENFLDFPVGIDVPTGYYDRDKAQWIASEDGRIVEIIDVVDGRAVVDVTGTGNPATDEELAALQISDSELVELAAQYQVGESLWRALIPHFTPWDCNWPYTFPEDAEPPSEDIEYPDLQEDDPTECSGSIIECQNQVLGKRIDIAGTPFTLNYRSNRAPGRRTGYSIDVPVSDENLPASLKRIEVEIGIAGRLFRRTFDPEPGLRWRFEWDGKDVYGRVPFGQQSATVSIHYVYDAVYVQPDDQDNSFAITGLSGQVLTDRARGEIKRVQSTIIPIGAWDAQVQGLGGWTIGPHHSYVAKFGELHEGIGVTRRAGNFNVVATRYAGHPNRWNAGGGDGDGGPARRARFRRISDVARAANGDLYVVDEYDDRLRVVEFETKQIDTVIQVFSPRAIDVGPNENLYLLTRDGVFKFSNDGVVTELHEIERFTWNFYGYDLKVSNDGRVCYTLKNAVQCIAPSGEVYTLAGKIDESGYSGEGGLAAQALLDAPAGLAFGPNGDLYIADTGNNVIRRVRDDGIIERVSGQPGVWTYSGDGGPAIEATHRYPAALAVDKRGRVFIGDTRNQAVRLISEDGRISTIAGFGGLSATWCFSPSPEEAHHCEEGTAARNFYLNRIFAIEFDQGDGFYIADDAHRQIYKIERPLSDYSYEEQLIASSGGDSAYVFDAAGNHRRTLDVGTGAVIYRFECGDDGFLTRIVDAHGNETAIRRDEDGKPLAIVGPFGQKTTLTLDENGYLARIKDPLGQTHEFTYEDGLLLSARDPNGNVSRFNYDADGRLVADTDPVGGGWTLSRTERGNEYETTTQSAAGWNIQHRVERQDDGTWSQVSTAPHGGLSMRLEDPAGNVESATPDGVIMDSRLAPHPLLGPAAPFVAEATMSLPDGQTLAVERSLEYSGDRNTPFGGHNIDETVTVNGRQYQLHYDAETRTWTRTSPEGRTSKVKLNEHGQVVWGRVGLLAPIGQQYNDRGQVTRVNQDTRTTLLAYDSNGYLAQVVDAESRSTDLENDRVGRTREMHLPGERLVKFDFDANGNVTGITPPERPTHGFDYNGVDLATRYEPPLVDGTDSTVETDYRLDRTVGAVTRADGGNVDLTYGVSTGLLSSIAAPQGTYSYTYLPNSDRLASATGPAGQRLDYAWNGPLVDQVTWSGEIDGQVGYAWDNNFWLDALTVNGQTIDYRYDNDGLVTGAGSLTLDYAPDVPLLESTDLGSVQTGWTYNEYGEPSSYQAGLEGGSTLYRTEFTRDRLGRITEKVETVGGMETTYAYEYDAAGRLIEVQESGTVVDTYSYDANGNRLSHDGTTGAYDAQDRLLSYGDYEYTYTPDGELKTKTNIATGEITSYTYDAFSNLRQVTLPDGTEIEYVIDAQNRRIGKKINGTLGQGFLYADQLNPVAELDGGGNIESMFVYASRLNVPDYVIKSGNIYRIITDHLGSVRFVLDVETGEIVQRMDYSAFGRVTVDTNPGFQPFGFAGGLYDWDIGLVRFGARDYDPEIGRWLTKDPLKFRGDGANIYIYSLNSPVNIIDVSGLLTKRCARGLGGSNEPPTSPNGNPLRHDYLVIDGDVYSFQAGDNMIGSQGQIDDGEKINNPDCKIVSRDPAFDRAALEAIDEIGAPAYAIDAYPGQLTWGAGARNCQTWADDVINRADEIYSEFDTVQGGW